MKKIALIIGHSKNSQGASNKECGTTEFQFNEPLALEVAILLKKMGFDPIVVYRNNSYSSLPKEVNETGADIGVSFHCNAFNKNPNGTESLYFNGSSNGLLLASAIQEEVVKCLGLKDRGIKPIDWGHVGKAGDRGGFLLKHTKMPVVIVEPFFIDSSESLKLGYERFDDLAAAYAKGITRFLDSTI